MTALLLGVGSVDARTSDLTCRPLIVSGTRAVAWKICGAAAADRYNYLTSPVDEGP